MNKRVLSLVAACDLNNFRTKIIEVCELCAIDYQEVDNSNITATVNNELLQFKYRDGAIRAACYDHHGYIAVLVLMAIANGLLGSKLSNEDLEIILPNFKHLNVAQTIFESFDVTQDEVDINAAKLGLIPKKLNIVTSTPNQAWF